MTALESPNPSLLPYQQKTQINKEKLRACPVCFVDHDVRVSGKKGEQRQFFCLFCKVYFIPATVNSERKKIWHDKIKHMRSRLIEKHLSN